MYVCILIDYFQKYSILLIFLLYFSLMCIQIKMIWGYDQTSLTRMNKDNQSQNII